MIRRKTPHTVTQNQVLNEESFTGKKGIDVTQAPVSRDTVFDICNMDIDLDGAMTIRKPLKSLDDLGISTQNVSYLKEIFEDNYFYFVIENNAQYIKNTSNFPLYLKDGSTIVDLTEVNLLSKYLDVSNATITNTNTSSIFNNIEINLQYFLNGAHYNAELGFKTVKTSMRLYKENNAYYLEYIDPYVATLESSDTLAFNPNVEGYYSYALTDTYDTVAVSVKGVLAYTDGTATTVKGLTETNNQGHYIISALNKNDSQKVILKAFCNFVKDTTNVKYYGAWEYSFDNVTWETLPEFVNQWQNDIVIIKTQNLSSINYELSSDTKTVYNAISRQVVSLNSIINNSQNISARPDIIKLNNLEKAVYRFVIYKRQEYFMTYTARTLNKLGNIGSPNVVLPYDFYRVVNTDDNASHSFEVTYTIPNRIDTINLTCQLLYSIDGTTVTTLDIPITITTLATTTSTKTVKIVNTGSISISPPTALEYVGAFGKLNATLVFNYINEVFDIVKYQVVYNKNSAILNESVPYQDYVCSYVVDPSDVSYTFDNGVGTITFKTSDSDASTYDIPYIDTDRDGDALYTLLNLKDYITLYNESYISQKLYKCRYIPYLNKDICAEVISDMASFFLNNHITTLVINVKHSNNVNTTYDIIDDEIILQFANRIWDWDRHPKYNTNIGVTTPRPDVGYDGIVLSPLMQLDYVGVTYPNMEYIYYDFVNKQYVHIKNATIDVSTIRTSLWHNNYYDLDIDTDFTQYTYVASDNLADIIGQFNYSIIYTNEDTDILNKDFINSNLGKKLYYKYRLYSYGDTSFKNHIYVSNSDSLITPLLNAIDLPITDDTVITSVIPWRDYLIASSEKGIFLITPTEDGFLSKILSTFIGIPMKDGDTLKSILNGAIFKSGSKVYILQPSIYASNDSTINIVDISKPISPYIKDTVYNNFAFTNEQYYFLCIPDTNSTLMLKYEFATKRWTKHSYPDRFISADIKTLDDMRIIGANNIYQFNRDFSSYITDENELVGYGDILNGHIFPIEYLINTGSKSYSMQFPHQFVESKILFSVLDDSNAQLPLYVDIYSDNFKNILHVDPSTSNTLWRDEVAPRDIVNTESNAPILTLSSDLISDDKIYPIMKQLFLRYSGKGFTVTHIIKGNSNCFFKCYVIYSRFKETINKK